MSRQTTTCSVSHQSKPQYVVVLPSPNSQDRRAITRGIIFSCLLDAGHRQESTKEAANDGGIRVAREFTRYISTHPNAQERVNLRGVLAKVLDEITRAKAVQFIRKADVGGP